MTPFGSTAQMPGPQALEARPAVARIAAFAAAARPERLARDVRQPPAPPYLPINTTDLSSRSGGAREAAIPSGPQAALATGRSRSLSFGDPAPFAPAIRVAGSRLICQVQTIAHTRAALDCGAEIIVAQGSEAGWHGATRATLTLVPEVADLLARESPTTLLVAAGGTADGRGLAASLMLGADGVMLGSRLWASPECLVHPNYQRAALAAGGDGTIQTAADIARGYDWPGEFTGRVLRTHLSRAGTVVKRSTARWRRPHVRRI